MIKDDINKLVKKPEPENRLDPATRPPAIRDKSGLAPESKAGGIASPLTETSHADREYYTSFAVASSDGLFVMEIQRIKKMKFLDGESRPVVLDFADKI